MTAEELLHALVATLEQIQQLAPAEKQAWGADERTALAVERLWIEAGNVAEEYRRLAHLDPPPIRGRSLTSIAIAWRKLSRATLIATECGGIRRPMSVAS